MTRKPRPAAAPTPEPTPDTLAAPVAAIPDPAPFLPQAEPDPTGAAVAAAAPVAPIVEEQAPQTKGFVLRVKGPAKGRWRAGRHFGPDEVEIAAADLTETQIAQLNTDPELTVLVLGAE